MEALCEMGYQYSIRLQQVVALVHIPEVLPARWQRFANQCIFYDANKLGLGLLPCSSFIH